MGFNFQPSYWVSALLSEKKPTFYAFFLRKLLGSMLGAKQGKQTLFSETFMTFQDVGNNLIPMPTVQTGRP